MCLKRNTAETVTPSKGRNNHPGRKIKATNKCQHKNHELANQMAVSAQFVGRFMPFIFLWSEFS